MIFYTNRFIPERFAACTRGPFIFIRPEYRDDIGLLEHEKTHVKQWYRTLGLHSFLYLFSKNYRLKSEVEAYRQQSKFTEDPHKFIKFAELLSMNYNLPITQPDAYYLLKGDS